MTTNQMRSANSLFRACYSQGVIFGKIIHALAEVQGQAEDWEKGNVSGMPSLLEAVGLGKV